MKKLISACAVAALCLTAVVSAEAAPRRKGGDFSDECTYTPLQELVRTVRDEKTVKDLMDKGVQMEDPAIKCGGNLLQLAIRRGNASVVNLILQQSPKRAKEMVSLAGFDIQGAPEKVPVLMFAGYYAPTEQIFNLIAETGGDVQMIDDNGNTVLWYMEQNPVLVSTATTDNIRNSILLGYSEDQGEEEESGSNGKKSKK